METKNSVKVFSAYLRVSVSDSNISPYIVELVEPDGTVFGGGDKGVFCADETQLACTIKRIRETLIGCEDSKRKDR